jgi:hypothetical protein
MNRKTYERIDYGTSLYCSWELKTIAKYALKFLSPKSNYLISSSSSGCALATAMLTLSRRDLRHLYLRKPTEKSHDTDLHAGDSSYLAIPSSFTFVDDFIASGTTLRRVIDYAQNHNLNIIQVIVSHTNISITLLKLPPLQYIFLDVELNKKRRKNA